MSTETDKSDWPIGALEPVLLELKSTVGILGHMFNQHQSVELSEWHRIEDELIRLTKSADEIWQQAWDHSMAEKRAQEAALAEAKAEKAAPGSAADLSRADATWRMLAAAAKVATEYCTEAGYKLEPFGPKITKPEPEPPPERLKW